jgi:hypothetical protein
VELRGLEPLTPTLPGAGRRSNQARSAANGRVGGVAGTATVVTVVVKTVVRSNDDRMGSRCHEPPNQARQPEPSVPHDRGLPDHQRNAGWSPSVTGSRSASTYGMLPN